MSKQRDFRLIVSTEDLANSVGSNSIKRDMINASTWLHDYCKDSDLMRHENLYEITQNILKYFKKCLQEEGKDIHDYSGCRPPTVNTYITEVIFTAYSFDEDYDAYL